MARADFLSTAPVILQSLPVRDWDRTLCCALGLGTRTHTDTHSHTTRDHTKSHTHIPTCLSKSMQPHRAMYKHVDAEKGRQSEQNRDREGERDITGVGGRWVQDRN